MALNIRTTAFENGKNIPVKYTCDGDNISPVIFFDEIPKGAVTLAMIMEDPDAPGGTFTHWIMYNIPAGENKLEGNIPIEKNVNNGAIHGINDFGKYGYAGPCPPGGEEHRYYIRVFALNKKLPPESAKKQEDFYNSIEKHVIEKAEYMGKYRRQ